jgi:D-glycero-D-manno-heptose 1,7-bisphosphate phosphatase
MNKAVFLDKDGTLIKDIPWNVNPALISLEPYAVQALLTLQREGFRLFVVSNEPGIARGYFSEADIQRNFLEICKQLGRPGVRLQGFYYCPHDAQGSQWPYAIPCDCRMPLPGLLLRAAEEHHIDLSASWMIGDMLDDVEAGNRAGCQTILLNNGHETVWDLQEKRMPTYTAPDLAEAADIIEACSKFDHHLEQL